jgi:hypothetical protein
VNVNFSKELQINISGLYFSRLFALNKLNLLNFFKVLQGFVVVVVIVAVVVVVVAVAVVAVAVAVAVAVVSV